MADKGGCEEKFFDDDDELPFSSLSKKFPQTPVTDFYFLVGHTKLYIPKCYLYEKCCYFKIFFEMNDSLNSFDISLISDKITVNDVGIFLTYCKQQKCTCYSCVCRFRVSITDDYYHLIHLVVIASYFDFTELFDDALHEIGRFTPTYNYILHLERMNILNVKKNYLLKKLAPKILRRDDDDEFFQQLSEKTQQFLKEHQ